MIEAGTQDAVAAIIDGLDGLVDMLVAAGVPATRNPDEMQPPAAIIAAPSMVGATLGAVAVTVPIHFVAADLGQASVDTLLGMLAIALPILGTRTAEPSLWVSPLNPSGLPSYVVTCQMSIEGG